MSSDELNRSTPQQSPRVGNPAGKPFALSVKAVVVDANERCLLIRRSNTSKFNAGIWDFPGGKVDPGESFDTALVREVKEETGLDVALERVAGAAESEMSERIVVYLIMRARFTQGRVTLSSEHDEFAWIPRSELAGVELCQQFRSFAREYANVAGGSVGS